MVLAYYPNPGEILLCDYGTNVVAPEMRKRRPAVVVTPRLRRRGELVGVVPLSTTEPDILEDFHCRLELAHPLPAPFDRPLMWAKCDMLSVVSRARLDRFKAGRGGGKRIFIAGKVSVEQLKAIRAAMLCGLGLGSLTIRL
jgi:mRNA interferase MazF